MNKIEIDILSNQLQPNQLQSNTNINTGTGAGTGTGMSNTKKLMDVIISYR